MQAMCVMPEFAQAAVSLASMAVGRWRQSERSRRLRRRKSRPTPPDRQTRSPCQKRGPAATPSDRANLRLARTQPAPEQGFRTPRRGLHRDRRHHPTARPTPRNRFTFNTYFSNKLNRQYRTRLPAALFARAQRDRVRLWLYLEKRCLSYCVWPDNDDILDAVCDASNKLVARADQIAHRCRLALIGRELVVLVLGRVTPVGSAPSRNGNRSEIGRGHCGARGLRQKAGRLLGR